ncbi:MAG: hypothetical protein P4L85_09345 [Paludisphaera borealis]|uniref:hypothetical protein n=1 Tax=Paludisphaera borealis TaxID=1387353 RepID=UPI00283F683A|nr:hypothetical protein [Paludisphaera borealis]MDR3619542.1 hypothetical protein [Paludisphaera borealis]
MKQRGRFIEWADLLPALTAGEGTLIIEQGNKCPVRIWWTPEDVLSRAPCPPPGQEELEYLCFFRTPEESQEFVAWCHKRYTDEAEGAALITVPFLELPPGLLFAEFFREQFPLISAVDTVYYLDDGGANTS